jgi:TrwC relaxase
MTATCSSGGNPEYYESEQQLSEAVADAITKLTRNHEPRGRYIDPHGLLRDAGIKNQSEIADRVFENLMDGFLPPKVQKANARNGAAITAADIAAEIASLAKLGSANGKPIRLSAGRGHGLPGVDVTLSPPKSVSLAWAYGNISMRSSIEAAQHAAVVSSLKFIEQHVAHARVGKNARERVSGKLIAVAFQHGETRPELIDESGNLLGRAAIQKYGEHVSAVDPQLHTHLYVMNGMLCPDGRWRSIGVKEIMDYQKAIGAHYHAALAHELRNIGFPLRHDAPHGIFEIDGIPQAAIDWNGKRGQRINEVIAAKGLAKTAANIGYVTIASRNSKNPMITGADRFTHWQRDGAKRFDLTPDIIDGLVIRNRPTGSGGSSGAVAMTAAANAVNAMVSSSAFVDGRDVWEAAANAIMRSGGNPSYISRSLKRMIAEKTIFDVGYQSQRRFATAAQIAAEQRIDHLVNIGRASMAESIDPALLKTVSERISDEVTRVAVEAVMSAPQTVIGVEAKGQHDREALIATLRDAAKITNTSMIAIDAESSSLATIQNGSMVIISHAGTVSAASLGDLMDKARLASAKVIIAYDQTAERSSAAIETAKAAGLVIVPYSVKPQAGDWQERWKVAVQGLEAAQRIDINHSALATRKAAMGKWRDTLDADTNSVVIVRTAAEGQQLKQNMRGMARIDGHIMGPEIPMMVTVGRTRNGIDRQKRITVSVGDQLRLTRPIAEQNLKAGTVIKIESISVNPNGNPRITGRVNGHSVTIDTEAYRNIAHGWTLTTTAARQADRGTVKTAVAAMANPNDWNAREIRALTSFGAGTYAAINGSAVEKAIECGTMSDLRKPGEATERRHIIDAIASRAAETEHKASANGRIYQMALPDERMVIDLRNTAQRAEALNLAMKLQSDLALGRQSNSEKDIDQIIAAIAERGWTIKSPELPVITAPKPDAPAQKIDGRPNGDGSLSPFHCKPM